MLTDATTFQATAGEGTMVEDDDENGDDEDEDEDGSRSEGS